VEKWLTWAGQDVAGAYESIKRSKPPANAWNNSYYKNVVKLIAARFSGVTSPPALPTNDDQLIVAGIHDRLKGLQKAAKQSIEIERTSGAVDWSFGPGNRIQITAGFLALTPNRRALKLLEKLLAASPMILATEEATYHSLINEIRKLR
jgi:hypothetical protein